MNVSNYTLLRHDRTNRQGGGVALWISNDLHVQQICVDSPGSSDWNFVCFYCSNLNFVFWCLYVPPVTSVNQQVVNHIISLIVNYTDRILIAHPDAKVVICGDVNQMNFDGLINQLNLINTVVDPTRGNRILDIMLISDSVRYDDYSTTVGPPLANSDHRSILFNPSSTPMQINTIFKTVHDLRESNVMKCVSAINEINWDPIFNGEQYNLDEKCEYFHSSIKNCINEHIPSHTVTYSDRDKPWITPLTKHLINLRWNAYRAKNFSVYNHLKYKVKNEIQKSKLIWAHKNQTNAKNIWKTVNQVLGKNSSNSMVRFYNSFNNSIMAGNSINDHFASIFTNTSTYDVDVLDDKWCPTTSSYDIWQLIQTIPDGKAFGSDGVLTSLYKKASFVIADPISHLINLSLQQRKVPILWKTAHVIALPKCSVPTINDLRPISLIPLPAKILEKVVYKSLKHQFVENFGMDQFGFRPRSSTTAALVSLHDAITRSLDKPTVGGVQVTSYDYSKAFDTLKHDIIIRQVLERKFPTGFVLWLNNYLQNRSQQVRIGNSLSDLVSVTSGVPQGSIIGPCLFNVVISDLKLSTSSTSLLIKYADDTTHFSQLTKGSENKHILAEHIQITQWSETNELKLNTTKSKTLNIITSSSVSGIQLPDIPVVNELKLLGFTHTSDATWNQHIDNIVSISSRRLYALRVVKPFVDHDTLTHIYFSIVRSLLEYCSPVFVGINEKQSSKLNNVQRRAHAIICGQNCVNECLPSLDFRRKCAAKKLVLLAMKDANHVLNNLLPRISKSHRSGVRFLIDACQTNRRSTSCIPFSCTNLF